MKIARKLEKMNNLGTIKKTWHHVKYHKSKICIMNEVIIIGAGVSGLSTASLLTNEKIPVRIFESAPKVGGRTMSMKYKNHILDNGFHIMPFYKTSAVYKVLKDLELLDQFELAKVDKIAFYQDKFHKYPKGIGDIFQMSLVPFKSRIQLLKILLPIAFSSYEKAEEMDSHSLTGITDKLETALTPFFSKAFTKTSSKTLLFSVLSESITRNTFSR